MDGRQVIYRPEALVSKQAHCLDIKSTQKCSPCWQHNTSPLQYMADYLLFEKKDAGWKQAYSGAIGKHY